MVAKVKETPVALTLFVSSEILRMSSDTVMVTCNFATHERDHERVMCRDTIPTRAGNLRVKDLSFVFFLTSGRDASHVEVELEYRHVHDIAPRDARHMADSFTTIARKLEKLSARFGRPESFATSFMRVCDVLGVERVDFHSDTIARYRGLHAYEMSAVDRYGNRAPIEHDPISATNVFRTLIGALTSTESARIA